MKRTLNKLAEPRQAARLLGARALALTLLLGLPVALGGCPSRDREEADLLSRAVEQLRAAPNEKKGELLPLLASVPCGAKATCDAKAQCLEFAEKTAAAMERKAEAERGLADVKAGRVDKESAAAGALFGKLDESLRLLREGQDALAKCDDALVRLRRAAR